MFHLFGALAQFEREIIRDGTMAGLAAARAQLGELADAVTRLRDNSHQAAAARAAAEQLAALVPPPAAPVDAGHGREPATTLAQARAAADAAVTAESRRRGTPGPPPPRVHRGRSR